LNSHAIFMVASLANRQDGRPPLRPEGWRMLVFCLLTCRSLREAILRAAEFYQMLESGWGGLSLHVDGAAAELRLDTMRTQKNATAFVADIMGIAALHGLFGWLIEQTIPLSLILLDYDEKLRRHFDSSMLPFPIRMGAERTAIRFAAEFLDFPVTRSADNPAQGLILSFTSDFMEDASRPRLEERARSIMYQTLRDSHRLPTLHDLSHRLGQNPATVRRHLSHAGVSYNYIKESCRRELSLDLLRRSTLGVEAIADRLGFCDSDAFRRWFRSWIGVSPSAYRRTSGTSMEFKVRSSNTAA
jgi:AraC-like DNA-binding protein